MGGGEVAGERWKGVLVHVLMSVFCCSIMSFFFAGAAEGRW